MFHLLIQLLHSEKFEDLSFKHFVVVTFSDTLGNILCLVNHFQCIKVFANEIHVLFDQAYKRAMVQILLTNFVYPFFKGGGGWVVVVACLNRVLRYNLAGVGLVLTES